jgi:hypothetical protein
MQSFSAMRQALASLVLRGPKAAPKKTGGGKAKDSGALKKKKVVKKAVVSKESSDNSFPPQPHPFQCAFVFTRSHDILLFYSRC